MKLRPRPFVLFFAALLFVSGGVLASDLAARDAEAKAEYSAAASAYDAKDFARAALGFSRADRLLPNAVVLKLALAAAIQAEDAALAVSLALRGEARAVDGSLAELASKAHAQFDRRVGKIKAVCARRNICFAKVGTVEASDGETVAAPLGPVVVAFFEETREMSRREVVALAEGTVEVLQDPATIAEPPPARVAIASPAAPPNPSLQESGFPPAFFWGGVIVTGLVGAAATVSGIDTLNQHSEFQAAQDPLLRDRGESAQLRTNVLLASTLGCALITAGIGIFLVRWGKPQTTARSFSQEPVLRF